MIYFIHKSIIMNHLIKIQSKEEIFILLLTISSETIHVM